MTKYTTNLKSCLDATTTKPVHSGDPLWDTMDNRRVRFSQQTEDGFIEVMDDDCRVLPDLRHPTQVMAY